LTSVSRASASSGSCSPGFGFARVRLCEPATQR
jgi:hypothetical protein